MVGLAKGEGMVDSFFDSGVNINLKLWSAHVRDIESKTFLTLAFNGFYVGGRICSSAPLTNEV